MIADLPPKNSIREKISEQLKLAEKCALILPIHFRIWLRILLATETILEVKVSLDQGQPGNYFRMACVEFRIYTGSVSLTCDMPLPQQIGE
ncbi:MAG: hypothetical protein AUJ47_03275 [Candidatus Marinimicrobia bacterium CG1_02_48_14]|nr:MAG: hypothetical protein AUJ47_03275 [Candidatus Marinimicrobia bacterium CG1_02_48_14]